jgi:3-dehydroquinate synthase
MNQLQVQGHSGHSTIYIDSAISELKNLRRGRRMFIITDENVYRYHSTLFPDADEIIVVPAGESSKNLEDVSRLYERLIDADIDRNTLIIGIGGGMVTDLAGFVAATLLRGVACGFVATTVLAQVDAAIGGKNGVNIKGYKNLVGTIRQPEFVINDTAMLRTLNDDQFINGLSEVIKSGLIADRALFELMETHGPQIVATRQGLLGEALGRAARVKVDVVNRDEFESGERRLLNLGHTYGHAVEKITRMHHGFAVAIGMVVAARLSVQRNMLSADDAARIEQVIAAIGLPVSVDLGTDALMDAMRKDKKRQSDKVNYVLLDAIGHAVVTPIEYSELERTLDDLRRPHA